MKGILIGERKTRFWNGEKVVFERVARGEWKLVEGTMWVANNFLDEIETWDK